MTLNLNAAHMNRNTGSYAGKVAIVTGGASGIGQALCEALCHAGARVIVADIDLEQAEHVASVLSANGGLASAVFLDVSNHELVCAVVNDLVADFGHLDYMFNNAAATATRGELPDVGLAPWHRAIDVNLLGVLHGTLAAQSVMAEQGFGHIVNIGSIAGLIGFPTSIAYGATKAAVVNLSVSFRMEAADQGVNVSVVCPGPVHAPGPKADKLIGVERAAQLILAGVTRNRAIIVFPFSARLLWWLHRLTPAILFPLGRKLVRDSRRKRKPFEEVLPTKGGDVPYRLPVQKRSLTSQTAS